MHIDRRQFVQSAFLGAAATLAQSVSKAYTTHYGIPGRYRGRVVSVGHAACLVSGAYQKAPIDQMVQTGMKNLTGAPSWQDAWRSMFEKGDVVGIKVSPVGGPKISSDATVLHAICDGLNAAGVSDKDIIVFNRYREEAVVAGITGWLRPGMRFIAASPRYDDKQLDIDGYDPNHFMEMALVKPGDDPNDPRSRRSYVAKVVTTMTNKIINLPVLKHHQSAGVTITLKNMSHGFVNNVNRSHITPTANACGTFIPSVVSLPIIRQKVVLHVVDSVRAAYHGGPGGAARFMWEAKTMYFGTDPVALDKTGWKVIDAKRAKMGLAPIATSKPDRASHFLNCQVEHIEIAGLLGLGEFDSKKIRLEHAQLG